MVEVITEGAGREVLEAEAEERMIWLPSRSPGLDQLSVAKEYVSHSDIIQKIVNSHSHTLHDVCSFSHPREVRGICAESTPLRCPTGSKDSLTRRTLLPINCTETVTMFYTPHASPF